MRVMRRRVLVVDDDPFAAELAADHLEVGGFEVEIAGDGRTALARLSTDPPDVCVLDIDLPGLDGLSVLSTLRRDRQDVGVVMLTAKGEEHDRIRGLRLGADDYLGKPFSPGELVARVESLLRRLRPRSVPTVHGDGLQVDLDRRLVTVDGGEVELTRTEFDLLAYLVTSPRRVVSRGELMSNVWGYPAGWDGPAATLTEHVRRLRVKVPVARITTVRGVGYRYDPPSIAPTPRPTP